MQILNKQIGKIIFICYELEFENTNGENMYLAKLKCGSFRLVNPCYRLGSFNTEYRCCFTGAVVTIHELDKIVSAYNVFEDGTSKSDNGLKCKNDLVSVCKYLNTMNQNGERLEHYQTLDLGNYTAYVNIEIEPNADEDDDE